ncbi:MAG: Ig-like domain-containing protein [Mogibacterium sp.]|nr:Ig-like domain-containing protein [Mogibacterium sp.]
MLQCKSNVMRSISIAVTVIFLFVSMLASTESVDAASKLKVNVTKKTIYVGQTAKLKANRNVKWSISKRKIVKLTKVRKKTVTVKGLKAGTVYVKAKAGKNIKKIKIVVKPKTKMRLESSKKSIGIGEFCALKVKMGKSSGAINEAFFSSSDSTIATVSNRGLVTGISPGTVTITAKYKKDKRVKASVDINVVPTMAGTLTLKVDLSDETRYPAGKTAKVWLPVPQSDDNQSITSVQCDVPSAKLTEDSAGGKQMYIEWDANTDPKDRKATLSYHLYRKAVIRDENIASIENGTVDRGAFMKYLGENYWSGSLTSGIVKDTANQIIAAAGAKTVYEKAFAI